MFLRKNYYKKTGRTYLQIVHGYRDKQGKPKSKVIKPIGYLDELKKEYDDPITYFTNMAKQMDAERLSQKKITLSPIFILRLTKKMILGKMAVQKNVVITLLYRWV